MGDHPGKNLKWLEQELLAEDTIHRDFSRLPNPEYQKDEDLLELVDILIGEDAADPEPLSSGSVMPSITPESSDCSACVRTSGRISSSFSSGTDQIVRDLKSFIVKDSFSSPGIS